jgi:hypothetical protein
VHGVAPKDERVARGDGHQLDPAGALVDEGNLDRTVGKAAKTERARWPTGRWCVSRR